MVAKELLLLGRSVSIMSQTAIIKAINPDKGIFKSTDKGGCTYE